MSDDTSEPHVDVDSSNRRGRVVRRGQTTLPRPQPPLVSGRIKQGVQLGALVDPIDRVDRRDSLPSAGEPPPYPGTRPSLENGTYEVR